MRTPVAPASGEPEPAHRGAEESERLAREQPVVELGPVDGRLLDDDRLARKPLGERGENVSGRRRSPAAGGSGAWRRSGTAAAARRRAAAAVRRARGSTAAGDASTASSTGLRCTSAGSSPTTRDALAGVGEAAGSVGRLPEHRRADDEDAS